MANRLGLSLVASAAAGCLALSVAAEPKAEKPAHSGFYREFDPEAVVTFCETRFKFVRDKCGTGSRGVGIKWPGEVAGEGFKVFDLHGDLSDDEVKQVLDGLQAELVKRAKAGKAILGHDPKDTIADRPMRLLQPG